MNVTVVGAGSWGMALAQTLVNSTRNVTLWARHAEMADVLQRTRRNPTYLTDIVLNDAVEVTGELGAALDNADIAIFAVPTHGFRDVLTQCTGLLNDNAIVVSAAKGFEVATTFTMTEVARDVLGSAWFSRIAVMSGPNIAAEVGKGLPAATVVASRDTATAEKVRDACTGSQLRFYSNDDVVGVEYGGALKNVIAIAAGVCDGVGAGDNGKAATITRGIVEMARLGVRAGANALTFAGLTGVGDCVATCMSPHSRNRQLGEAIGKGSTLDAESSRSPMVAEGVNATRAAVALRDRFGIDMPIATEVHAVLFEGKQVRDAMQDLMRRDPADELRGLGLDPVHSDADASGSSSAG